MKRHRVTIEIEIDMPEKMSPAKAVSKLRTPSASVTLGKFSVIKDEPTPEELLPYEQYDNEKIAIRNAILEVLKKNGWDFFCVALAGDNSSYDRLTHLAARPMRMTIWPKSTHELTYRGQQHFRIIDGVIWDQSRKTQISRLADPDFRGLVIFLKEFYWPTPPKAKQGYPSKYDETCYKCCLMEYPCGDHV